MSIQFQFHTEKAVEATAFLLKLHHCSPVKYLDVLKMLYIADRIALQCIEQPITGDSYVSMDYGPVLSSVYDLIKGKLGGEALSLWSKFISPRNSHCISLIEDPGNDNLCEEEEEILRAVY